MLISIIEEQLQGVWRGPHLVATQNSPLIYHKVSSPLIGVSWVAPSGGAGWNYACTSQRFYIVNRRIFPIFLSKAKSRAPLMLSDSLFMTHVM